MALIDIPTERGTRDRQPPTPVRPVQPVTPAQWASQTPAPRPPPDRAQPAWAVEDRRAYQQAKQQLQQQRAVLERQVSAYQGATQNLRNAGRYAQLEPIVGPLGKNEVRSPERVAYERQQYVQSRPNQGVSIMDSPVGDVVRGVGRGAQNVLGSVPSPYQPAPNRYGTTDSEVRPLSEGVYRAARQEIPGMERVRDTAGEALQPVLGETVGDFVAGAIIPVEVWEAALVAIPIAKARTVGELASAVALGDEGAINALRRAGARLGKSELVEQGIKKLASETGGGTPFDPLRAGGEPEDILAAGVRAEGDVASGSLPAGDSAVSPPSPVSPQQQAWELIPPRNQKLIGTIAEKTMDDAARDAMIAANRSRKSASIAEIFAGPGTPQEKFAAANAARRGADAPLQQPLGEFFDDTDIQDYKQQIVDAVNNGTVHPQEGTNAGAIIDLLMDGRRPDGTQRMITRGERALMGKIFGPELMEVLPDTQKKMTLWQKALAPFQLWRSLKTAFDVGAMFRQGRKVIFSDPMEWLRASRGQFRAMGQRGYERTMEAVRSSKHYALGQSAERPLGILEQGGGQADEFLSPLTKKIPGLAVSERLYNSFLNILRQGIFDKNMDALTRQFGDINSVPEGEIQRIIDNINTATMFGNISKLGDWQKVASQTLFSARALVSSPQFYADAVRSLGPNASPEARKIILRRTASAIGADLTMLAGIAYLGAYLKDKGSSLPVSVDNNPFSQTLGDAKIGPVKWNPWGPDAPLIRAIIQGAWGKQQREGESKPRDINGFDRATSFGRTKLSPAASILYDLFLNDQRDFRGRPIRDRKLAYASEQVSPIIGYSMYDAFREEGLWGGVEGLQGVGIDVQVYGASETVEERAKKEQYTEQLTELSDIQSAGDIAVESYNSRFPEYALEATTWDEAVEELKELNTAAGKDYRDSTAYKEMEKYASNIRQFEREKDPKIDAYYIIVTGQGKPLTVEAQKIIKEETGIEIALNQNAD